jgi:hypothetical protein
MKKVIFVGGTSYSGSTFFDMTLGNDPAGFSVGEVYALFHPYRPHHIEPPCGCGDAACTIWSEILAAGEEKLYETLFALNPEAEFIVDSSKDPFWIARQVERLQRAGIETRHILIWKTPLELAASFKKRDELAAWEKSWVNYYRLYHTLVSGWRSVPYAAYTQDTAVLPAICAYLDIPYFAGKEAYWEKTHHLLFGNDSARVHLAAEATGHNGAPAGSSDESHLQTIYYHAVEDNPLQEFVDQTMSQSPYMADLVSLLKGRDVRAANADVNDMGANLRMSRADVQLRRFKQALQFGVGRLRYA